MSDVYVIDAVRTPHGAFLGSLADVSAVELGGTAVRELATRVDVDAAEWLAFGNAISAGLGQVPARQVVGAAGLPTDLAATTVNEASGSGLRAIALAVDRIEAGRLSLAVAGGTESMSNAPHLVEGFRKGRRHGDATIRDAMIRDALWDVQYDAHMGALTEDLVDRFDLPRDAQDEYAAESHRRAAAAIDAGVFDAELAAVETPEGELARDEGPRPGTTAADLSELRPAFRSDGTLTAGNSSDLSDGAAALLVGTAEAAADLGVDPLARVVDYAVAYRDPKWFGMAVADAVERLLNAADLAVADVAAFELNEAFAAQMLYVRDRLGIDPERLNPRGGAIALGHPIGASGGMLTTSLVHALDPGARGIVGMSVGGGGGIAALVERLG